MGQNLSKIFTPCGCAQEIEEPYQMAVLDDNGNDPQWKEKIHPDKIVFAVDPKSSEEEIAAKRKRRHNMTPKIIFF